MAKGASKKVVKRKVKVSPEGLVFIRASFNNIIISITNKQGEVISWASAGKAGFRGSKKNTPYAAQVAANDAAKVAYEAGMRTAEVYVKGHPCRRPIGYQSEHHQRHDSHAAQWMPPSQTPPRITTTVF
jgi:ribosomal protein S11